MAGGAYDGGQKIVLDKDPTQDQDYSIAQSRKAAAAQLAQLGNLGNNNLLALVQLLIGKPTSIEDMFKDFDDWIKASFQPLVDLYDNIEDFIADFLATWNVSLGNLSPTSPNLQVAPDFNSAYNVSENARWKYDPLIGDPSTGSFKLTINGKEQAVTGTTIQVGPNQKVDFKIKFKWVGLVYTGNPLQLKVREIDTGNTVYLGAVNSPGTNGGWVEVAATYTTPSSGVTAIKIRPTVTASATAGSVWIDAGAARKNGLIQQDWVQDLTDDFNETWDAISGIFEAFGSIGDVAGFQTAIGKLLDLLGVVHPDDLATLTPADFWLAIWNSFMHPLGVIAPQAGLNDANSRQARMAENSIILLDLLHWYYPEGHDTDTPTTTINGRRTWWAAYNDVFNVKTEAGNAGAIPAAAAAAPLKVAQRFIASEDTLATVQAQVADLVGDNDAVGGRKYSSTAVGGGPTDWGTNWTLSGNGTPTTVDSSFSWVQQTSGQTIDRQITGLFTGGDMLTDDGIVSAVIMKPIQTMLGVDGPYYEIRARENAAQTNYLFARAYATKVQLGYAVGGVETIVATASSTTVPAGGLFELVFSNYIFAVRINGQPVPALAYSDTGHTTQRDLNHRKGGQKMFATHGVFGDQFAPPPVRIWIMKDLSTVTDTYGSTARFYRVSTSGVTKNNGSAELLSTETFDTIEYCSPDIKMLAGGIVFYTPGLYRLQFATRFSAAQATAMAPCVVRRTPSSTVIYSEDMEYNNSLFGLGGTFLIPVLGDGGVGEAWTPGMDVTGSGTYNIIGDGAGIVTWCTIEKVA